MRDDNSQLGQDDGVTAQGVAGGLEIFRAILSARSSDAFGFTDFRSGIIGEKEGYKERIYATARERLGVEGWNQFQPGEGKILSRVIQAIEIPGNNVLSWWPPAVAHRKLVEIAQEGGGERVEIERHLRDLYLDRRPEPDLFADLVSILGQSYPLIGYLFFMKDITRFVPVSPTGIERGLVEIGADLTLRWRASWQNYAQLLSRLEAIRIELARQTGVEVRLLDAHSFIWVLGSWPRPDAAGRIAERGGETITATAEKARLRMVSTILDTIRNANGQMEWRRVKDKNTDMTQAELDAHIAELMAKGRTCPLTGCEMLYDGEQRTDFEKHFLVSADRIDNKLSYVRGNIQIVCQFANFWKGSRYSTAVFHSLLAAIQQNTPSGEADEGQTDPDA